MNAVLPFEGFLDLLRAKGYAVSLREHFTLASLLQRWDGTSRAEFRDALAALIGRNEEEVQGIRRLFVELYGDPEALPLSVPSAAIPALVPQRRRTWIAWTASAVVLAGVLVFAAWRVYRLATPAAEPPVANVLPPAPVITETGTFTLPPPPPPIAAVVTGVAFLVALAVLWGLSTRNASRRFVRDVWSTTISELPGPHRFSLSVRNRSIGFRREALEDAATILGRAFAWETPTRELDVGRSIRQTLRQGLLARLVFRPRRLLEPVLVFQDIGQDMSIWRTKVQSLLTNLAGQGIALERYYFDGDLRRVTDRPHRSPTAVERVMRRRANSPVLVISTGTGLAGAFEQGTDQWLNELRARARRSWLTPVVDLRLWPGELTRLSIPVWPMTARGLTQAAKDLAGIDGESPTVLRPRLEAEGYVTLDGIERMKRLASLVPHPTVDLLETLRVRFAPDVPDAAVLHLFAEEGTQPVQVVRLSEAELRRCLDAVRNETPRLEAQVRTAVVEALRDSEPPAGSAAHLRWQAAIALQALVLADLRGDDTSEPVAALRKLGQGPAWDEVRRAARLVPSTPTLTAHLEAALQSDTEVAVMIAKSTPVRIPGERAPMRRARPGLRDVVPATALAAIVFVAGWQLHLFPSTTTPPGPGTGAANVAGTPTPVVTPLPSATPSSTPIASPSPTASPVPTATVPPATPTSTVRGSATPSTTPVVTPNVAARLDAIRTDARAKYDGGDRKGALASALDGLKLDPQDRRLLSFVQQFIKDAQGDVTKAREAADKVGSAATSSPKYQDAKDALQRADQASSQRNATPDDVIRRYRGAASLFDQAAEEGRRADPVRTQVSPPRPTTAPVTPPPTPAPTTSPGLPIGPTTGAAPGTALPPPPPPPSPTDIQASIRTVLSQFIKAYNDRDAAAVVRVFPQDAVALKKLYDDNKSQKMTVSNDQISLAGNRATLTCVVNLDVQGPIGFGVHRTLPASVFQFQKIGDRWVVASMTLK